MKTFFSIFAIISFSLLTVGCASSRVGTVGYNRQESPILVTNVTRTVTRRVINGQETVEMVENSTITSTPAVQKRTWSEKLFGSRPPGETQVIPAGTGGKNEYVNRPRRRPYYFSTGGYYPSTYGNSVTYGGRPSVRPVSRIGGGTIPHQPGIVLHNGALYPTGLPRR